MTACIKCWVVLVVTAVFAACSGQAPETEPNRSEQAGSPTERPISRIAFGSCAFQWAEQPIWKAVVAAEPDIYISLGDAIYGDFDGKKEFEVTPASLEAEWQKLADHPDWQHLISNLPVMSTWDNHDYGHHSAGAEFALKEESQEIFLDFFGEPAGSERRASPGIYDAKILGPPGQRVQIILLDTWYFKGLPVLAERPEGASGSLGKYAPNEDAEVTLLGETQWHWLGERLREPAEIRLIVSSGQIVPDQKGMDEWGNYPHERRRLLELIGETGAAGVILLSGNVHFTEISETDEGPYPLVDFTSSGLTHVNKEYPQAPNRYRVGGPYVDLNFGVVEIDWEAEPDPVISLKAIAVDGTVAFEHQVSLAELR